MHRNLHMLILVGSVLRRLLRPLTHRLVEPSTPPSPPSVPKAHFIGDDPLLDPPPASQPPRRTSDPHGSRFGSAGWGGPPSDPSAWSDEQQQQFLRALLSGTPPTGSPLDPDVLGPNGAMTEDPLLALMSNFTAGAGAGKGAGSMPLSQAEARPKTMTQKLLPILHVFSVWALVAFFVIWMEPEAFRAQNSAVVPSSNTWNRWAQLATGSVEGSLWRVETVVSIVLVTATGIILSDIHYSHFSGLSFPWSLLFTQYEFFRVL